MYHVNTRWCKQTPDDFIGDYHGIVGSPCGPLWRDSDFSSIPSRIHIHTSRPKSPRLRGPEIHLTVCHSLLVSISSQAALPNGWSYMGCYIDNANGNIMNNRQPDSNANTHEECISACQSLNYTVAGMEYGTQCSCDDFVRNGAEKTNETDCNVPCSGDSTESCGAGNRMSIFSTGPLQIFLPPAAQSTSLPGSWKYQGCLTDPGAAHALPYQIILADNNTAENCLSQCSEYGYPAGGMEYGRECYCGDPSDTDAAGCEPAPESECSTVCTGDEHYLCGGGSRMSYYTWTGDPLYVWNKPTGNDAGLYEMFISGVVVPLITTPARNGKITFVEKHGTGEPNGTGAYELDPSLSDNFDLAWREMTGIKTDVFCAAGLTLPDRGARQVTVGGWATESTYGVRLYWPDGRLGENGTNQWQENADEIALQVGRWYPTAMLMANGSILVVGGEDGSNGAPVPSLEILPKPDGGFLLDCEWLRRTDPYNLYPFMAVLPSGGILAAYYNEARILDENTLETKSVLPNMPGAVNNFLGGRTYPFEGTSMLMPQRAPYTEPLTVLICGGSTPGPEIAIDNCVSIEPETPNANWTIERMPSKRVIVCMVALPDGTYLILNGAHQGAAGFGTSSDPNLQAVLYNPTLPLHHRMSIMSSTTIARMYHSEAVLMDDGRILVSGSDPQDTRYPEEYRVEVFIPPYRMSGAAIPTFSVQNVDWEYGGTYTFTVDGASNYSNIRVSLVGAVSSTHGNSMGQRTFFPAMSCSGNSCTVTAPPDKHACPPSWFQMFVLDGPTPSHATWVRIGGDPAALGNWPPFDDFSKPGVGGLEAEHT
ncbi:copper radical oxidase [Saccharata proteae CBS 121410]|uniref:Copper radical oxidase n=1 Tax=Saccharata proteae CBS 121410 TaxID=1314787 RepID=A0A9P4LW09_9PEZI|nr:copper radical oxidase [Saccharata proteae CBS 121410]